MTRPPADISCLLFHDSIGKTWELQVHLGTIYSVFISVDQPVLKSALSNVASPSLWKGNNI